jgi:hypothetical protein
LKLLFEVPSKKLLGVHIIGEGATELIHIGQMVMIAGGTIESSSTACSISPHSLSYINTRRTTASGGWRGVPSSNPFPPFSTLGWASYALSMYDFSVELQAVKPQSAANAGLSTHEFPYETNWQFPCSLRGEALSRMRCRVLANAPREGSYARGSVSAQGDSRGRHRHARSCVLCDRSDAASGDYKPLHRIGTATAISRRPLTNAASLQTFAASAVSPTTSGKRCATAAFGARGRSPHALTGARTSVRGGSCSDATPEDGVIVECDFQRARPSSGWPIDQCAQGRPQRRSSGTHALGRRTIVSGVSVQCDEQPQVYTFVLPKSAPTWR